MRERQACAQTSAVCVLLIISSRAVAAAPLKPDGLGRVLATNSAFLEKVHRHESSVHSSVRQESNVTMQREISHTEPFRQVVTAQPGLLMGIFVLFVSCIFGAFMWAWRTLYPTEGACMFIDMVESPRDMKDVSVEAWKAICEKGELDLYTCFGLSLGRHQLDKRPLRYVPRLAVLVCLQILLGVLFITYQADRGMQFYTTEQGWTFRMVGGMLFLYSCWRLHESMFDDCREWVLTLMWSPSVKSVSGWYLWPVVAGDFVNTFVSYIMMFTLFLIFCKSTRPQDLLINCVAINFVADIDNQLVQDYDHKEATENFQTALSHWAEAEEKSQPVTRFVRTAIHHLNTILRVLAPLAGGYLAFMFTFAHDVSMCHRMQYVEPWPFCLGIQF